VTPSYDDAPPPAFDEDEHPVVAAIERATTEAMMDLRESLFMGAMDERSRASFTKKTRTNEDGCAV